MAGLQQLPVWADKKLTPGPEGRMVVGQLGQSLDGYIATSTGHSKYINGSGGLAHLHQLRAYVDAVLVGVGTVVADDPMLTVRLCPGRSPARIVLDPRGRVPSKAKIFQADGARRIVLTRQQSKLNLPLGVEVLTLPEPKGLNHEHIDPAEVLKLLAQHGMRRILVEGGAHTLSQFINADCIDHLHLIVAPLILGAGKAGLNLNALKRIQDIKRFNVEAYALAPDLLFDCDLRPMHQQK